MRTRKVIALSLLTGGAALLFSGCPSNPPSICTIARTAQGPAGAVAGFGFAVHYYYSPGLDVGDCSALDAGSDFSSVLWTEAYGGSPAVDPTIANGGTYITGMMPEEFGWTQPYLQTYIQGSPMDPNPADPIGGFPIIYGAFTSYRQDTNGECTINQTDAGSQLINGTLVTYSFPKVLVYNDPYAGEGTQLQIAAQITRGTCTRSYVGIGMWPIALCNVDNDCNPNAQPSYNPPRPIGSGLLPGFNYACSGADGGQGIVSLDLTYPPANVNVTPTTACLVGAGTLTSPPEDSCVNAVPPSASAPANSVCDNTVATITNPPVACTVDGVNGDSCDPDGGTYMACVSCPSDGGACSQVAAQADGGPNPGSCGTLAGNCAFAVLDAWGCGSLVGTAYMDLTLGCGGAAKDNDGTAGVNICFYANPGPTTFPYTNTPGK